MDAMTNTLDSSKENSSSVPLMVVENGCGSPCIDLRQVSSELAAAAKYADLVGGSFCLFDYIITMDFRKSRGKKHNLIKAFFIRQIILEGMGRALHTNLNARFKCDALKVRSTSLYVLYMYCILI